MPNPSFRQKFIPGDHGPHHNPYIIPISDKPASRRGNIILFAMIAAVLFITDQLLRNDPEFKNQCSATLPIKSK